MWRQAADAWYDPDHSGAAGQQEEMVTLPAS